MIGTRVGIDIVPLTRVTAVLDAPPEVLARHLAPDEIKEARRRGRIDTASVAGKLAAKEAVFKLFRQPGAVLPWLSIRITTTAGGWPKATLTGSAAAWAAQVGIADIDLSIAHDGNYAVAAATAHVSQLQTIISQPTDAEEAP